jgi:hypothetical protein
MADQPSSCHRQQELIEDVQRHLIRISELTRSIAEALANGNESFAAELDKEVDLEFGLKERGMGALHQHRKEHGC